MEVAAKIVRLSCLGNQVFGTSSLILQFLPMTCLNRGIKRPMPFHAEPLQRETMEDVVDKRVMTKQTLTVKGFLQHIKDVPERTWREEREATWEIAIRRWILLLEQWETREVPLLEALHSKSSCGACSDLGGRVLQQSPSDTAETCEQFGKDVQHIASAGDLISMYRGTVLFFLETRD